MKKNRTFTFIELAVMLGTLAVSFGRLIGGREWRAQTADGI